MAVTKIWAIKDSLQRVLNYAANPDKTEYDALAQTLHYAENDAKTKLNESAQLVTGIHCRADHAWEDMRAVQERFGKTDGVVALHAYQSFREGEVTPEQCHEIGVALARKVWGGRFQVLVATHMNTDNLHNHFVINSVSYVDQKRKSESNLIHLHTAPQTRPVWGGCSTSHTDTGCERKPPFEAFLGLWGGASRTT